MTTRRQLIDEVPNEREETLVYWSSRDNLSTGWNPSWGASLLNRRALPPPQNSYGGRTRLGPVPMQKSLCFRQLGTQIDLLLLALSKFVVRRRGHGGDTLRISMFMEKRDTLRACPVARMLSTMDLASMTHPFRYGGDRQLDHAPDPVSQYSICGEPIGVAGMATYGRLNGPFFERMNMVFSLLRQLPVSEPQLRSHYATGSEIKRDTKG